MRDIDILNVNLADTKAGLTVSGNTVTGIKLLAQRVLVILLTDMTETLRSREGAEIYDILVSYQNSTDYASLLLISAISTVKSILFADTGLPDAESLRDIVIQDVHTTNGTVEFSIEITNKAGDSDIISYSPGLSI